MNTPKILEKTVIGIFVGSILLVVLYIVDVFETQISLFENHFPHTVAFAVNGTSTPKASIEEDHLFIKCTVKGASKYDVCGASFIIGSLSGQGFDFSDYYAMSIDLDVNTPRPNAKVKFSLRNANDAYSVAEIPDSNKYNSIVLTPSETLIDSKILLNYFQVESWWVREYNIAFEDSRLDFSNIIAIDFINNNIEVDGIYTIKVNGIILHRQWINLSEALTILAFAWLVIIVLLVARNKILLHERATKDHLTGIANRSGLQEWIDKLRVSDKKPMDMTMFYMDIDDFKKVNDTHGHAAGDYVLTSFCNIVKKALKKGLSKRYIFTRLSGDEFAIFALSLSRSDAKAIASDIFEQLTTAVLIDKMAITICASVGISQTQITNKDLKKLTERADLAMYYAKQSGKNQFKIYDAEVENKTTSRKELARLIGEAIKKDAFDLSFMPIFDIRTKKVRNVEVLLRPQSPELEEFGPSDLVPVAEEYGLIQALDYWVMHRTFEIIERNRSLIEKLGLCFSINVSTLDLQNEQFSSVVYKLMDQFNIEPNKFALEITETAFECKQSTAAKSLKELSERGITIVLDNFGTGYTSLSQLINYPISSIKIDTSSTQLLEENKSQGAALIRTIIHIAKEYDFIVTAEGVETLEQFYFLKNEGCDFMQGFLYSQPLSIEELIRGLRNQDTFGSPSL